MYSYSIIKSHPGHEDEVCLDIKRQYDEGIADCALFCMTLTPEGAPPIPKAQIYVKSYGIIRDKLAEMGAECGILAQATIGHGYKTNQPIPFTKVIGPFDEVERNVCCPFDEGFRKYIRHTMHVLAEARPKTIMVDDDFRLLARPARGCACKLHMKRLSELAGKELSRDELKAHLVGDSEEDIRIKELFIETQRESLVGAAREMRRGINEVDPRLPASFCACGNNAEFATEIATVLAGEGNPVLIRVNNGNYTPIGAKGISRVAARAAIQITRMRAAGHVDAFLAETDTCPQNRYSTSAHNLHSHYIASILEGAIGAKHWITRLASFEPKSGEAYRRMLSKYSGYYRALGELMPKLSFIGCKIPLSSKSDFAFKPGTDQNNSTFSEGWACCAFERLGIPMYYSEKDGGIACFDGEADSLFTNAEIENSLHGVVLLDEIAAERLCQRGFEKLIGVKVRAWEGAPISGEELLIEKTTTRAPFDSKELIPISNEVVVDSYTFHLKNETAKERLFPAVTVFKNDLGGTVITYAGVVKTSFTIGTAFSILNESRKAQLTRLLSLTGEVPIYYDGDAEVYMKAAKIEGRERALFAAIFNVGLDPLDEISLRIEAAPKSIEYLTPSGEWKNVDFAVADGVVTLALPLMTLEPQALIIDL